MADENVLWVGGLADEVTEDHLFELFMQAGPLEKVSRPKEKEGNLKSYAFVEFRHAESVPYAIQVMDGIKLFNHHLRLKGRTGSQHDNSRSASPSSHSDSPSSRTHGNSRGGADYHRSRSFHGGDDRKRGPLPPSPLISQSSHPGHGHQKRGMTRSSSGGEDRRGDSNLPFNGPAQALAQPFNNNATYSASNMQPQSYEGRRNRLLQKQNMSSSFQAQAQNQNMGHNQYGGYNFNNAQSFGGYNQQQMQQQQQWYPNQW